MAEILTQQEIDDLIAAMGAGEPVREQAPAVEPVRAPSPQREGQRERRVRVYDFRRPDKFSKEQLRTISMIHDNFTRLLATFFSAHFRAVVQLSLSSVDQMTYGEFTRALSDPTVLSIFTLKPLKGNGLLDITPAVAFPMIDRLFGGPGQAVEKIRPLTEIEQTVMDRLSRGFLSSLAEAWRNVIELEPRLEAMESNPMFAQIASPNEIVVAVVIDLRMGEHRGNINLCLPYLLIEPVLPKLSAHSWFASSQREATPELLSNLNHRLAETGVPLIAVLGQAAVSVRDLLGLEAGDVVRLDTRVGGEIDVTVGSRPKFTGQPGTFNGRLAVRIKALAGSEEDEDE